MNLLLLIVSLSLFGPALGAPSRRACKCLASDPCWPSDEEFSKLASEVSQPLLRPVSPASACYPVSNPSGNCGEVRGKTADGIWRAAQPGAMQSTNWETHLFPNGTISACYLNTDLGAPCEQGSVPVIGVDARSASDIQAAVKFVKKHNLRVVVKSTGHDYLGRSTARGAFLIWVHNLQDIVHHDAFVPEGADPAQTYEAVTIGAGVQWRAAYEAVQTRGRVLVGGGCDTVGAAGGWVMGGGHALLSPSYGLGVDNALEFLVVTSDGDFIKANSHSHPDLFWALRGGGGGTYGIVTSVTYRTHGPTPLVSSILIVNGTSPTAFKKIVTEYIRLNPSLSDAGWAGYGIFLEDTFISLAIAPSVSWADANTTWDPFFAFARRFTSEGLEITVAATIPFDSWYTWYKTILATVPVGENLEMASRLLPKDVVAKDYKRIADATVGRNTTWQLVAGGVVTKIDPDSTGLNPAWRKTLANIIHIDAWPEGVSSSELKRIRERVQSNQRELTALAPDSGAYFNEASLYEPNPQQAFFGSHYPKLRAIKRTYDPSDMFVVADGVGSEDWDESLNCRA